LVSIVHDTLYKLGLEWFKSID